MKTSKSRVAKISSREKQLVNNVLKNFLADTGYKNLEDLKMAIVSFHLCNPDNFISCPKAGPDIWLKHFVETKSEWQRFICSNGNSFVYNNQIGIVTKAEIIGGNIHE